MDLKQFSHGLFQAVEGFRQDRPGTGDIDPRKTFSARAEFTPIVQAEFRLINQKASQLIGSKG